MKLALLYLRSFPCGSDDKEYACNVGDLCRKPRFDPCVGKIPWRREQIPTPVYLPGEFMNKGTWWATVHWISKSQT